MAVGAQSTSYTYDRFGNIKTQLLPGGVTATRFYGYDAGRTSTAEGSVSEVTGYERDDLISITYTRQVTEGVAELVWKQELDYTPTGQKRISKETKLVSTATLPVGQPREANFSTRRVDWGYDGLDRLISERIDESGVSGDVITTYTLDMVGNRLSEVKIDGGGSSPTTVETTHSYRATATGYLDILTGTSSWKSAAGASQQLVEEVKLDGDETRRGRS